jgi:hypothetical protein
LSFQYITLEPSTRTGGLVPRRCPPRPAAAERPEKIENKGERGRDQPRDTGPVEHLEAGQQKRCGETCDRYNHKKDGEYHAEGLNRRFAQANMQNTALNNAEVVRMILIKAGPRRTG